MLEEEIKNKNLDSVRICLDRYYELEFRDKGLSFSPGDDQKLVSDSYSLENHSKGSNEPEMSDKEEEHMFDFIMKSHINALKQNYQGHLSVLHKLQQKYANADAKVNKLSAITMIDIIDSVRLHLLELNRLSGSASRLDEFLLRVDESFELGDNKAQKEESRGDFDKIFKIRRELDEEFRRTSLTRSRAIDVTKEKSSCQYYEDAFKNAFSCHSDPTEKQTEENITSNLK